MKEEKILIEPIISLPVSSEFRQMAMSNGFVTIQDILNTDLDKFHALPDSGYRLLKELHDILKQYGLQHKVE